VRASGDLIIAVVVGAIGALVSLMSADSLPLRALFAAPLVFGVPGYAATAALFPRRLDWADWLLLTPCLAVVVAVLGALVLNVTPWGLNLVSWAVVLLGTTIAASIVAAWRRARAEVLPAPSQAPGVALTPVQWLALSVAAVITGSAIWLVREPVAQQPQQGYAVLWALPVQADSPASGVRIGVQSFEPSADRYDLRIVADGQTLQQFAVDLQPGDAWEADITLPPTPAGLVEAQLYRADAPDAVYRRVSLQTGP
jgi:hypothetical protein